MKYQIFILVVALVLFFSSCESEKEEVNVYSGRHYQADEELFRQFTAQTGIEVNLIKGNSDQLINRMLVESENTQADIFITADVGRLTRAVDEGILSPIYDQQILDLVPVNLRHPENYWVGLMKRARIMVYHRDRVNPAELSTYEDLADKKWQGRLLVRSSQSHYNQSLMASIIAALGVDSAQSWAEGLVRNMAQSPRGNDRDQVKAIAAGIGDIAIVNTYYMGLLLRSSNEEERRIASEMGLFFPNQNDRGAHINVSGMGLSAHAQNKGNAIRLMRFLLQDDSQAYLSSRIFEYPVVISAPMPDLLNEWGQFKGDTLNISELGRLLPEAMFIFDRVDWQ
jgi:iron(III) transport system substrate-binding protein